MLLPSPRGRGAGGEGGGETDVLRVAISCPADAFDNRANQHCTTPLVARPRSRLLVPGRSRFRPDGRCLTGIPGITLDGIPELDRLIVTAGG